MQGVQHLEAISSGPIPLSGFRSFEYSSNGFPSFDLIALPVPPEALDPKVGGKHTYAQAVLQVIAANCGRSRMNHGKCHQPVSSGRLSIAGPTRGSTRSGHHQRGRLTGARNVFLNLRKDRAEHINHSRCKLTREGRVVDQVCNGQSGRAVAWSQSIHNCDRLHKAELLFIHSRRKGDCKY